MTRSEAQAFINALVSLRESATDEQASTVACLYPTLKGANTLIKAGTRVNHNGTIKRASVDLWDIEANSPDNAPALWEDISYKGGYRIIPETITAGTAFSKDEKGWWEDVLYISLIDNNVWTPQQNSAGWQALE